MKTCVGGGLNIVAEGMPAQPITRAPAGTVFIVMQSHLFDLYRGLLDLRDFVRMVTQIMPRCPRD
jgi:hypothetical protein